MIIMINWLAVAGRDCDILISETFMLRQLAEKIQNETEVLKLMNDKTETFGRI
jgi:hypothetical protein